MKMREFIISKGLWDEWMEIKKENQRATYRKYKKKYIAYNKQYRLDKIEEVKRKQREAYQRKKLEWFKTC